MARRASSLVEAELATGVTIQKIWSVICRLEIQAIGVAFRTTKGSIHLVVANQTIFHVGEICFRQWPGRRLQPAVAGLAGIIGEQICSKIDEVIFVRRTKILFAFNCGSNQWGKVAQAEVVRVVEILENFAFVFVAK